MARQIQYGDALIEVPDDATDDEVAQVLAASDADKARRATASVDRRNLEAEAKPFEPGPLESAGRYMAEWGQGMRDAASNVARAVPTAPLKGAGEAALALGSGIIAPTVGMARKAFTAGGSGAGLDYRDARDAATYKPQSEAGQALVGAAGAVAKPVADAAGFGSRKLEEAGVDPELSAMAGDLAMTAADLGALRAAKGVASSRLGGAGPVADFASRPFGPEVAQARKLDFRVLPSQVNAKAQVPVEPGKINPSPTGTWGQTFAGPTIKNRFAIDNQKRVNKFAARDLGISEISEQSLELAKYPHNAVYNEVARVIPVIRRDAGLEEAVNQLGGARRDNPLLKQTPEVERIRERILSADAMTTQQVLDAIREYRKDAKTSFQKVGDVEAEQAAYAYRGAADALEQALERQASSVDPSLVPRLRDARMALAKIHNYQDVFDGTNIDPQGLVKLGKKYPLSGYAKEIADVATSFPHTMKLATGLEINEPSNQSILMSTNLAVRRALGREQVPTIMEDKFQTRYGMKDPSFDPRPPSAGGINDLANELGLLEQPAPVPAPMPDLGAMLSPEDFTLLRELGLLDLPP
jgi:hypothetical protein